MSSGYKNLDSTTISFGVAPRINACGRMGHADEALNLFLSKDIYEVNELTKKLNDYNKMRQEKEQKKSNRTILKLIIVIILIGMSTFILRIAPNYIKDEDENAVKLVINYQDVTKFLKANIYKSDSGIFYLSKEDIANFYDKYIYYCGRTEIFYV